MCGGDHRRREDVFSQHQRCLQADYAIRKREDEELLPHRIHDEAMEAIMEASERLPGRVRVGDARANFTTISCPCPAGFTFGEHTGCPPPPSPPLTGPVQG